MPLPTELADSYANRSALFATYREALHQGLLVLPPKDNDLSELVSRQYTGLPDGRLYRAVRMLHRAGLLRIEVEAEAAKVWPVEDPTWPDISTAPVQHANRASRWWYHVIRLLEAKE